MTRKELGGVALGGFGAAASASVNNVAPGIKLCAQSPAKPIYEQLFCLKQLGAQYVSVGSTPDLRAAEKALLSRANAEAKG